MEVVDLSRKGVMKKAAEKIAQIPSAKEMGLEVEQDSAEVDGIKFVTTTAKRNGVQNMGHSIGFGQDKTQFVIMAHQDPKGGLSLGLNVITYLEKGERGTKAHLQSYSLRGNTVSKIVDGTYKFPTIKFKSDRERLDYVLNNGFKDLRIEPT